MSLRVVSKSAITKYVRRCPEALEPLIRWYWITKRARWQNLADAKRDFPHADQVGELTVFSIGANKYRLIAAIKYRWQMVYIRFILTHKEYDKNKWKP